MAQKGGQSSNTLRGGCGGRITAGSLRFAIHFLFAPAWPARRQWRPRPSERPLPHRTWNISPAPSQSEAVMMGVCTYRKPLSCRQQAEPGVQQFEAATDQCMMGVCSTGSCYPAEAGAGRRAAAAGHMTGECCLVAAKQWGNRRASTHVVWFCPCLQFLYRMHSLHHSALPGRTCGSHRLKAPPDPPTLN